MKTSFSARPFVGLLLLAGAALASAENYVAKIYGVPAGQTRMEVLGAGDNGMMTGTLFVGNAPHPVTLTPQGYRDLMPAGWQNTRITNSWGSTYHVGYGDAPTGVHAAFWVGGGPGVDLNPPGAQSSKAYGVDGQYQVGKYNLPAGSDRPVIWNRTATSYRELLTTGLTQVVAFGVDATGVPNNKVWACGSGFFGGGANKHAVLWQDMYGTSTDIHVSGYDSSEALGCDYPQIVGMLSGDPTGDKPHAAVWTIGQSFAVDLHPGMQFSESTALAVRNKVQVGFGRPFTQPHREQAILWHGVGATWTNLHARLPYPFNLWSSRATDIDNLGNVMGYIFNGNGDMRPVVWQRV